MVARATTYLCRDKWPKTGAKTVKVSTSSKQVRGKHPARPGPPTLRSQIPPRGIQIVRIATQVTSHPLHAAHQPPQTSPILPAPAYHHAMAIRPIGIQAFDVPPPGTTPLSPAPVHRVADPRSGAILVPCVRCGRPAHEHRAPRITIGRFLRVPNPNLGGPDPSTPTRRVGGGALRWHGPTDTRTKRWIAQRLTGPGCDACAAAFRALRAAQPTARDPFLPWPPRDDA